jgi:pimeloyl-ACP methyl ester carboxylesterase
MARVGYRDAERRRPAHRPDSTRRRREGRVRCGGSVDARVRVLWEYKGGFFKTKGVSIPVAVTVFPREQYQAPRGWAERAYPNLIYFNEVDRAGHFAAWEQSQLFTEEIRAAFRSLR